MANESETLAETLRRESKQAREESLAIVRAHLSGLLIRTKLQPWVEKGLFGATFTGHDFDEAFLPQGMTSAQRSLAILVLEERGFTVAETTLFLSNQFRIGW